MNRIHLTALVSAAVLLATSGVAFAQTTDQHPPFQGGQPGAGGHPPMHGSFASTTRPMMHGSTTPSWGGPMFRGTPGVVTSVGASQFTIGSRGFGANAGTTTLTVTVSASTTYFKIGMGERPEGQWQGSSTMPAPIASTTMGIAASFADVTVGTKVEVLGKVATSTKTIAATRVMIGNDNGPLGHGPAAHGSTTPPASAKGLLDTIKSFFGIFSRMQGGSSDTTGGPAAAESSGFMSALMSTLFGWLH